MKLGALGKMVGPLPLGAWVAAVGGALAISQASKLKKSKAAPVYDAGAIPFPTGLPLQEPGFSGASVGLPSSANPYPAAPPITTNTEWQRHVVRELIGRGFDAYTTGQAIGKYLQGLDPLNATEAAIVDSALRYYGQPPQPPSIVPPPLPPTAPPPTAPVKPPTTPTTPITKPTYSVVKTGWRQGGRVRTPSGTYTWYASPQGPSLGNFTFQPVPAGSTFGV